MTTYNQVLDANKQSLDIGDSVHHSQGFAIVIEIRSKRAIIQFADYRRLFVRGIDLIKMS